MPVVDRRSSRFQALWGYGGSGHQDVEISSQRSLMLRRPRGFQRGLFALVQAEKGVTATRPIYLHDTAIRSLRDGGTLLGYAGASPVAGQKLLLQDSNVAGDLSPELGWAYLGEVPGSATHSARQTFTQGSHVIGINRAAGGYVDSWEISGVEILNRGDRWGRGLACGLEWVDIDAQSDQHHLTRHNPRNNASRYDTGIGAHGAPFVSVTSDASDGGLKVTITTVPIEWDPDGGRGQPGVMSDHGGSADVFVLWPGFQLVTELWLEYQGTANLHRLRTTWTIPEQLETYFLDCGESLALCLNDAFNEIAAYDGSTKTVQTPPATDWTRVAIAAAGKFTDDVAPPPGASPITGGEGGLYGRNTTSGLTVGVGGRLQVPAGAELSLGDVPRGTQFSFARNSTGTTGHDGAQAVILGLDRLLTGRWHDHDKKRIVPAGSLQTTRWIATGTEGQVQGHLAALPVY